MKNPKFKGSPERLKNRVLLEKELEKSFTKKTTQDWMGILEKAGVPAGPIFNMKDVWNNEQVKSRNMDVLLDHPTAGTIHNIGIATKLSETPGVIHSPAPLLGQHTSEILNQLGYEKPEIEELKNNGTLKWLQGGKMRFALAGFNHETNTFHSIPTEYENFEKSVM